MILLVGNRVWRKRYRPPPTTTRLGIMHLRSRVLPSPHLAVANLRWSTRIAMDSEPTAFRWLSDCRPKQHRKDFDDPSIVIPSPY